jgi:hypothetical protein
MLYGRLAARFPPVEIANEGMAAVHGVASPRGGRAQLVSSGEYYRINCFFCNDTQQKLWVNHLWFTPDPVTGEPMRHLAICYKSGCLREHYLEFEDAVMGYENATARRAREFSNSMRVLPGIVQKADDGPVPLPGPCVPIDQLSERHPAVAYICERGFDPAHLADAYDVSVCGRADEPFYSASGRIIAPVVSGGIRVGWQGRYVGEVTKGSKIPKYYTMPNFKKSHHLYNADRAQARSPKLVVVVEGVIDAWAGGSAAVASFGKTLSEQQHQILGGWAKRGGLCMLCFDPGAWTDEVPLADREKAAAKREQLMSRLSQTFSGKFVEVQLPFGTDPAKLGRSAFRDILASQAGAAGFDFAKFEK